MATMNMTQICKANGITEFSRSRRGWMKLVEGYDNTQYGGYRFVGSNFITVGNFDTEIKNGLYLDCSRHFDKENDCKVEIMNLFKIEDGTVELINTHPKSDRKWAEEFESDVAKYFSDSDVTSVDILNAIQDMTCNHDILHEVGRKLLQEERKNVWLNLTHFDAYMQQAGVYRSNYELYREELKKMAVEMFHNDHKAREYFNYKINNDYELRMLYAFIHCNVHMKKYADFEIVYEDIKEDHYLNMNNLKELEKYNWNETNRGLLHDVGYWISLNTKYANRKTIYIIVPNVPKKTILIQRMEIFNKE